MKQNKITLYTITPMFMTGADGQTPELRTSEFKGMMRFWWRAIKADDNIDELRKKEAEIFGGTENEGKSKVKIKIYPQPSNQFLGENLRNEFGLEGIRYLLYPCQEKKYIKPNFQFNIELLSYDENFHKNALASLWTSIYLGGFGTRARRGAGNIAVEKINGNTFDLDFIPKGETSENFYNWIKTNLNKCFNIINNDGKDIHKNFCTKYSNLSFSRIIISNQTSPNWQSALNDIGKIYSEFRRNHRSEIFDTAVFGFPIVHKGITVKGNKENRRSSPIIFKIIKIENNFFWYAIRLAGEFLEEGSVIKVFSTQKPKTLTSNLAGTSSVIKAYSTQKPDYKLIDEFWNQVKNKGKEFVLSQPEILNNIIEKIKTECNPDKIILFGSRARGDAHKNADIDIAIENSKKPISINAPIDIVDLTKANSSLKDKIKREGIIIYERKS
jgi:CRISPR-associated protein Cmr1